MRKTHYVIGGAVLALLIGGWLTAGILVGRVLETEKLRQLVAGKIAREIGGSAGFLPLSARGFSVTSRGLTATAAPPRALTEARANELTATARLIELWRGKWRIDHIGVRHLQVAFGEQAAKLLDRSEFPGPEMVPPSQTESPMKVDIRQVSIARTDLLWADPKKDGGSFHEVETTWMPDGENLIVRGHGGLFQQAKWPETRVCRFAIHYAKPALRIDEGQLTLGGKSTIDVTGGFRFEKEPSLELQLKFEHCPIAPFLHETNGKKIAGLFRGEAKINKGGADPGLMSASGSIATEELIVKNVVALEKAAAFTGKPQLNPLKINKLEGSYRWASEELKVRDFRVEANKLLCLRGAFSMKAGEIEGTFELGVAPDIVAKFPGAREDVFTRAEGDYLWTPVKISGPFEHLRDDLKPRLMSALEKHFVGGLLAPVFKPGQAAREVIEQLFSR